MVKILQLIILVVVFVLGYSFGAYRSEKRPSSVEQTASSGAQDKYSDFAQEGSDLTMIDSATKSDVFGSGSIVAPGISDDGRMVMTNLEGAKLEVTLVEANDDTVTILRKEDQREFTIKLATLQPGDREAIENWRTARNLESPNPKEIDFDAIFGIFED